LPPPTPQVRRSQAEYEHTTAAAPAGPTPIVGYLDLLRTRGERMTSQKRRDCLDLLADRAAYLSRLVEDLLIASRIGNTDDLALQVSAGIHDLAAVVGQVVSSPDVTTVGRCRWSPI
jgi:K+-sensing histidine kinase KdpD